MPAAVAMVPETPTATRKRSGSRLHGERSCGRSPYDRRATAPMLPTATAKAALARKTIKATGT